jgi:hypothetical protein
MEDEIDRDLQRKRRIKTPNRPIIDADPDRAIMEFGKYRALIELEFPKYEIIKKRKLVR